VRNPCQFSLRAGNRGGLTIFASVIVPPILKPAGAIAKRIQTRRKKLAGLACVPPLAAGFFAIVTRRVAYAVLVRGGLEIDFVNREVVAAHVRQQASQWHGQGPRQPRRVLDAKGVFVSISDGREKNGIRMPAWREELSDPQIWGATVYVVSISKTEDQPARTCRNIPCPHVALTPMWRPRITRTNARLQAGHSID
jgi:hypothetical protein